MTLLTHWRSERGRITCSGYIPRKSDVIGTIVHKARRKLDCFALFVPVFKQIFPAMPTIPVERDQLFKILGQEYSKYYLEKRNNCIAIFNTKVLFDITSLQASQLS